MSRESLHVAGRLLGSPARIHHQPVGILNHVAERDGRFRESMTWSVRPGLSVQIRGRYGIMRLKLWADDIVLMFRQFDSPTCLGASRLGFSETVERSRQAPGAPGRATRHSAGRYYGTGTTGR